MPVPKIEKPEPIKPEPIKEEPFDIAKHIKQKADERLKLEQQQHDQYFGRGGIAELVRPI